MWVRKCNDFGKVFAYYSRADFSQILQKASCCQTIAALNQFTAVFASECKLIIFITNMFTVNCLNPGVMPSVTFPPISSYRKHFVSLGEDKSLAGVGLWWGEILYVPSDRVWFLRVSILKYGIIFGLLSVVILVWSIGNVLLLYQL